MKTTLSWHHRALDKAGIRLVESIRLASTRSRDVKSDAAMRGMPAGRRQSREAGGFSPFQRPHECMELAARTAQAQRWQRPCSSGDSSRGVTGLAKSFASSWPVIARRMCSSASSYEHQLKVTLSTWRKLRAYASNLPANSGCFREYEPFSRLNESQPVADSSQIPSVSTGYASKSMRKP